MNVKNQEEGSIVVEAAIIIPFIIMIIMNLMYMTLYLHDEAVIQSELDQALLEYHSVLIQPFDGQGSLNYEEVENKSLLYPYVLEGEQMRALVSIRLIRRLEGKLLLASIRDISIDHNLLSVVGEVKVKPKVSISSRVHFFPFEREYSVRTKIAIHTPANATRIITCTGDVIENIKGFDKVMNKISELLEKLK